MKISTLAMMAFLVAAGPLHADVLNIALDFSTITLSPGQSFTFSGAIGNSGLNAVDLNGIDITLDGALFQVDTSPFFSGPLTVASGTSTPSFMQFSVMVDVPYNAPFGVQSGTLTILGGIEDGGIYDPTVQDVLGSIPFDVNVVSVPEPSTFGLMASAMLAGIGMLRRKRKRKACRRRGGRPSFLFSRLEHEL